MKAKFASCLAASTFLFAAVAAHAAPIATLSCTGTGGAATANLSFYTLQSSTPTTVASSGAGAGKISLLPLTVHAALSQFQAFYAPYFAQSTFSSCVLAATVSGQAFKIVLKDAKVSSFNASASNNSVAKGGETTPTAFIEFTVIYTAITVEATGADDGGTGASGSVTYNLTTNSSS